MEIRSTWCTYEIGGLKCALKCVHCLQTRTSEGPFPLWQPVTKRQNCKEYEYIFISDFKHNDVLSSWMKEITNSVSEIIYL